MPCLHEALHGAATGEEGPHSHQDHDHVHRRQAALIGGIQEGLGGGAHFLYVLYRHTAHKEIQTLQTAHLAHMQLVTMPYKRSNTLITLILKKFRK